MRTWKDEIRQQFVYFGRTERREFISSLEGELHWIDSAEILNLHISTIVKFMLEHYFRNPNLEGVTVGTITMNDGREPQMQWAELKDPMIF